MSECQRPVRAGIFADRRQGFVQEVRAEKIKNDHCPRALDQRAKDNSTSASRGMWRVGSDGRAACRCGRSCSTRGAVMGMRDLTEPRLQSVLLWSPTCRTARGETIARAGVPESRTRRGNSDSKRSSNAPSKSSAVTKTCNQRKVVAGRFRADAATDLLEKP